MRPRIALLAVGLALAASLFPATRALAQDCATGASFRVINLSPSAGAVDILVGGQVVATNVAASAASAFIPVNAGTVSVQINKTGTQDKVVGPVDVTTTAGGRITLVTLSQTAGGGQQPVTSTVTTQVFTDDLTPPAAGLARIRVIQGSSDAGAIDLRAGNTVLVSNVAAGAASAFVDVPAGTALPITVVNTGTTTTLGNAVNLDLVAGRIYTIFVSGSGADKTVVSNLLVDRAFDAQARFVHASPDAPAIDVLADGRALVTNLAYPNATPYVALPAGGSCVAIAPTGTTTPVIPAALLNFTSASKQTVVVLGQATGTPALSVGVFDDTTTPPAADKAKVRVIHASPDAGTIDVLAGGTAVISNVAFGTASNFTEVNAGTLSITVAATGTTTPALLGPIDLTLSGGQIVTVIVRGKNADKTLGLTLISDVSGG